MKINDYFAGNVFIKILNEQLENKSGELFLVLAEYTGPFGTDRRTDWKGLDIALSLNPEQAPIIFSSFMPEEYFANGSNGYSDELGKKFHSVMARKRVGFLQLPFTSETLAKKYEELLLDEKEEDILAIEINRINIFEKEMGSIKHGADRYIGETSDHAKQVVSKAVSEARIIGLTGTDEEIAEQIKNFKYQSKSSIFAGKFFSGVYCDVEGTLIIDGEINISMLAKLKKLAGKKSITLWTGGKVDDLKKILLKNGIVWKLISKSDLTGAEVETAYDDEDFSVFFEKYGVKVKDFNKVLFS